MEQVPGSFSQCETKTASFNLRADFEADLPSASDHRMVVIDMAVAKTKRKLSSRGRG